MAATTSTGLMTWEEFEKLPDGDGYHREILEGELQVLPPPKSGHTKIAKRAYLALLAIEPGLGQAYVEAGYKLSTNPATWVQPGVSFLRSERVHAADEDGYFLGAPDLAIEVISPSESAVDVQRKVALMLSAGSEAVWAVYSKTRMVEVHLKNGTSYTLGVNDQLSAPFLLPGWEYPVAKLFED
jgi:Uma2 family endonuclease